MNYQIALGIANYILGTHKLGRLVFTSQVDQSTTHVRVQFNRIKPKELATIIEEYINHNNYKEV